jgi:hypothetical protein
MTLGFRVHNPKNPPPWPPNGKTLHPNPHGLTLGKHRTEHHTKVPRSFSRVPQHGKQSGYMTVTLTPSTSAAEPLRQQVRIVGSDLDVVSAAQVAHGAAAAAHSRAWLSFHGAPRPLSCHGASRPR